MDGHSPHATMALSDFCFEKGIKLISLFPNTTHLMQPMDVALFHPLKSTYRDAVKTWRIDNDSKQMSKEYFPGILQTALNSLDTNKIFKNGFKSCGLFPFSENGINYTRLMNNNGNSEMCDEVNTSNKSNESLSTDLNSSDSISFVELNIEPDILKRFRNKNYSINNCIYCKFWFNCTKADKVDNENSNQWFYKSRI